MSEVWDGKSGYLQPGDVDLIRRLAKELPPEPYPVLVYDLGAGSGTTALSVFSVRPTSIRVISVDIDKNALRATEANMVKYGHINRWQGVHCRGDKAPQATALQFKTVNMLMCDCTHDYASKQDELNTWFKYLAPGALIWIHEYAGYANSIYPGVRIAVDEFVEAGKLIPIAVQGYSWGGRLA